MLHCFFQHFFSVCYLTCTSLAISPSTVISHHCSIFFLTYLCFSLYLWFRSFMQHRTEISQKLYLSLIRFILLDFVLPLPALFSFLLFCFSSFLIFLFLPSYSFIYCALHSCLSPLLKNMDLFAHPGIRCILLPLSEMPLPFFFSSLKLSS